MCVINYLELGVYDYNKEFEYSISTSEVASSDTQWAINDAPKNLQSDTKKRIQQLNKITEKYRMLQKEKKYPIKKLLYDMDSELDTVGN